MNKEVPVQKSLPAEIWMNFREFRVLRKVEEDPETNAQITAAA
jgi:hypothetical protein